MNRYAISAFLALAATYPAPAQHKRQALLPDTLGANFPLADTATKSATPADYDALIGMWHFHFRWRNPDGTMSDGFSGHWTFEKKAVGLIEDRWRADDPAIPMHQSLYTYRSFDPKRQLWLMMGRNPDDGTFNPGLTWSDRSNRYLIQHSGPDIITRIRYYAIDTDRFSWRSDRSTDGGKTWVLDSAIMEATRIGK